MNTMNISQIIMEHLNKYARGQDKAIPRGVVLAYCRLFYTLTDREFRDIYSKLPVCSCAKGLFIPQTPEELEEFRRYMKAKAVPMFERWRVVATAYPHLVPEAGKQMELF